MDDALKAYRELPPQRLAALRTAGLHAIRFEFVVRLLHDALRMDTISIFWDHDEAALQSKAPGSTTWRLVLGHGRRITAEFPDLWVLGYPDDPESKRRVEDTLERMVEKIRAQAAARERASPFPARPAAPEAVPLPARPQPQ